MAAQPVFSLDMFPVGVPLMEDGQNLSDMPRNTLPAPQLVMLANVAAVTAAEGGGGCDGEKEMMELKTVGGSYSDRLDLMWSKNEGEEDKAEDLSCPPQPHPSTGTKTPPRSTKRKEGLPAVTEGAKKKKPFHCKPCHFQAENEQEFVDHLSSHSISKMMVVNRVEGRSKTKAKEAETPEAPASGEAESGGEVAASADDIKGLIRCERCGYNTNRYDHYIAHLKHHNKEGEDHRVFKCTLCPYTTVSQYHWRKHLRNHFPSKLHTCSQCSYFSDRKSNYIQHIRTHTGVRPFQCPYCDYSSSQKTHLTRHMRTHSGERPFKCESCTYLAANQHEVTRHARQVHNGPKPLSCPYCEYKTADRSNYKKHVELHLNPRQFLCPLCKYAASKKCNLQYHIKSRHSGCNVALDVSKVKLRVKKPGPESAEEKSDSGTNNFENSSGIEEDLDMDKGDEESSPINLSIRKSSRPSIGQPVQTETPDKVQKKSTVTSEKLPKAKDKVEPEKKATRQKKAEKLTESPVENASVKEIQTGTASVGNKVKRRVKKLPAEKVAVQDQAEAPIPQKDPPEIEKSDQHRPEEARSARQKSDKEEQKVMPEKERENKKKDNKNGNKARRSEDTRKVTESSLTAHKSNGATPAKQKKTRSSNKKATIPQPAADPAEDGPSSIISPSSEAPEVSSHLDNLKETNTSASTPAPPEPEKSLNKPSEETDVSPGCSSSEATPSPAEDRPAPTFLKPKSPPSLVLPGQRSKPADPEDDEGIHSSHEGGSDISDSASEGSDDSGLNGNGAGLTKMANDPETPTDEIPTPTELKSHTCIFCDRTFPLEVEYRRHLNRHLVNVYYMDSSATAQK
uniref:RE1-silencing transcription factor n=1 Tax=Amphilophus citrinellus TaxID=61819 RepID=A0A3Q0T0A7_AMPCI